MNDFTSQTFGASIPKGLCFSTCFPISILLDSHQIKNSIACGEAPKNNTVVNHYWLTLDDGETIIDPTIRQFDPNMPSVYLGKLTDNEVTKKYVPVKTSYQEWFHTSYNLWAEPLTDKQPRTLRRAPGFEDKINKLNIKTATILYAQIETMSLKEQLMQSFKCERYFLPIFTFLKNKLNSDKEYIDSLKEEMPEGFEMLVSRAVRK